MKSWVRNCDDMKSGLHCIPQMVMERPVVLKDLSYLQHRDFKVHGGLVGDQNSDLTYNNISKQIDEGVKRGLHRRKSGQRGVEGHQTRGL